MSSRRRLDAPCCWVASGDLADGIICARHVAVMGRRHLDQDDGDWMGLSTVLGADAPDRPEDGTPGTDVDRLEGQ